jgi:hypothetical protein
MPKFDAAVGLLIEQAGDLLTGDKSFVYPNIPEKKLKNALTSIAKGVAEDDVLLLVDSTIFGSAKDGVIVTADKIFLKEAFTDPKIFRLRQIEKITFCESQISIDGEEAFSTAGMSGEEAAALVKLVCAYCDQIKIEQSASLPSPDEPQSAVSSKKLTKQVAGRLVEIGVEGSGEADAVNLRPGSKRFSGSSSASLGSVPGWGRIAAVSAEMSPPDSDGDSQIELSIKLLVLDPTNVSGFALSAVVYQRSNQGIDIVRGSLATNRVYLPGELPSEFDITEWLFVGTDSDESSLQVEVTLIGFKCDWLVTETPIVVEGTSVPLRIHKDPLERVKIRGLNVRCAAGEDDAKVEIRAVLENQKTTHLPIMVVNVRALDNDGEVAFEESTVFDGLYSKRQVPFYMDGQIEPIGIGASSKVDLRVGLVSSVLEALRTEALVTVKSEGELTLDEIDAGESLEARTLTDTYAIRLPLTKGSGDPVEVSELNSNEREDIRECCVFTLDWDVGAVEDVDDLEVTDVAVIYDGVTPLEDRDDGVRVDGASLVGRPAPVICITLNRDVSEKDILRLVWGSSVRVWPSSRANNDSDPFYFEDHNGYTGVLGGVELEEVMDAVHESGLKYRNDISFSELREGLPIKLMFK